MACRAGPPLSERVRSSANARALIVAQTPPDLPRRPLSARQCPPRSCPDKFCFGEPCSLVFAGGMNGNLWVRSLKNPAGAVLCAWLFTATALAAADPAEAFSRSIPPASEILAKLHPGHP